MRIRILALLAGAVLLAAACAEADGDVVESVPAPTSASGSTSESEPMYLAEEPAYGASADGTNAMPGSAASAGEGSSDDRSQGDNEVQLHPGEAGALRNHLGFQFPPPPYVPMGPLEQDTIDDLEAIWLSLRTGFEGATVAKLGQAGDARLGWVLSDILRFFPSGDIHDGAVSAFQTLTGASLTNDPIALRSPWQSVTDHMIAWDLPAFESYADYKGRLFTLVDARWQPFFDDNDANIDWRWMSWGGVLMDDRPLGDPNPCTSGCIPALDDPVVTDASGGSWYSDDSVVFAVAVGDEARAYPRHIMEIHEMVNDTLGGRRLGIPYCTLCGSAQAYFTDDVPPGVETPVLRTSGLLSRSNKVMFDLVTTSVFDTFTGEAVSGPLRRAGVVLNQATVVTTTWGAWKADHPNTTIIAQDGGIGRSYPLDPLRGRDDNGPIFPVGDVDGRLSVHDYVFGIVLDDGTPIAFDVSAAIDMLSDGGSVEFHGVTVLSDGSGLRAVDDAGNEISGHQSFWFAWSQFMPDTLLWQP